MRLFSSALAVFAAVLLCVTGVWAQDRTATRLPDTDLPGFDYEVLKDTDLDTCEAACLDDRICLAFTFNADAGWCFLKGAAGAGEPFEGATSGRH
jgi:alpha-2-macroglobulin